VGQGWDLVGLIPGQEAKVVVPKCHRIVRVEVLASQLLHPLTFVRMTHFSCNANFTTCLSLPFL